MIEGHTLPIDDAADRESTATTTASLCADVRDEKSSEQPSASITMSRT